MGYMCMFTCVLCCVSKLAVDVCIFGVCLNALCFVFLCYMFASCVLCLHVLCMFVYYACCVVYLFIHLCVVVYT